MTDRQKQLIDWLIEHIRGGNEVTIPIHIGIFKDIWEYETGTDSIPQYVTEIIDNETRGKLG